MEKIKFSISSDEDISELYEELTRYFEYQNEPFQPDSMGIDFQFILDTLKNGVKILSEIITTWLNGRRTVLEIKKDNKSLRFEGNTHMWENEEVLDLINKFFEE